MDNERLDKLEGYVPILRGLISYHKRMMCVCGSPCYATNRETGEWEYCKKAVANNNECPKATGLNDWYLGALEESLRLMEKEIAIEKNT